MEGNRQQLLWKGMTTAAAIAGAVAARNAAKAVWKKATSEEPPTNPAEPQASWAQATGFALTAGAAAGLARMLARRGAAEAWRSVEGRYPEPLRTS